MRFLHTSDWHLGRSFHGADLLEAQAAVLAGLVEIVRTESVDAVLVAGDLYDRALPGVDAVELWGDTLDQLCALGVQVIAISGNHDSARRLVGGGTRQLARVGVHVRTEVYRAGEPVILTGAEGTGSVAVYAIPYLDPLSDLTVLEPAVAELPPSSGSPQLAGQMELFESAVGRSAARPRKDAMGRMLELCRTDLEGRPGVRSVVMAHGFVAGGRECDSERELSVGGAGRVPVRAFAGFDYAALGHLHGQQTLGDGEVRYSGSPLAYSFSEASHRKGCWLVDLPAVGPATMQSVPLPEPRGLAVLTGTADELLTSPSFKPVEDHWISVRLTDEASPAGAMARLQRRFPHCVELRWQPIRDGAAVEASYAERVRQPDDLAIATAFIEHVRGTAPSTAELEALSWVLERRLLAAVEV
jgi:exonuclease SbcD